MSLTAGDIVALARAGYNAEQISLLNQQSTESTPSTPSTPSTDATDLSTPSTPSTDATDLSTPSTTANPATSPDVSEPATSQQISDLMAQIEALKTRITQQNINNDSDDSEPLTGDAVLAAIIDPRQNK